MLPTCIVDEAVLQLYNTPTNIKLLILPVIRYVFNFDILYVWAALLESVRLLLHVGILVLARLVAPIQQSTQECICLSPLKSN